ncbi:hypothetical protein AB834_06595 [PVC group bacterium (ex Bugula neritina AB1)]|nr:hypothetical protein AB834_06595 [PVC group bacterium (ex Bugula neritina AB1)]
MSILGQLVLVFFLGTMAQWVGWRLNFPAILLLLVLGIFFGPVAGIINPDQIFGDLLMPLIAFSLAVILFEGGLTLKISELRKSGSVIFRMIVVCSGITWLLSTLGAYLILDFNLTMSFLLGAILVVTGPTVILPMLNYIKPADRVRSILKWEGIVNDAIGAVLVVLVFETALTSGFTEAGSLFVLGILKALVVGTFFGLLVAFILIFFLKQHWIPDFLQNSFVLMGVLGAFVISNFLQHESGLLAVTLVGVIMGNQRFASIRHVIDFKENLQVILIAGLFVILSSRLDLQEIRMMQGKGFLFVVFLVFLCRPLAVFLSTYRQKLALKERIFISFLAPRGIIAAAVSVVFSAELEKMGVEGARMLVPVTFIAILGTVFIYGLLSKPLAVFLKLAHPNPQGLLILGSHRLARNLAKIIASEGVQVVLVDSNLGNVTKARMAGLLAYRGDIFSESFGEDLSLNGIGFFLALTENDEINALSALHMSYRFNRSSVFQLPPDSSFHMENDKEKLYARILFQEDLTYKNLYHCLENGGQIKKTNLSEEFTFLDFRDHHGGTVVLLFVLTKQGKMNIVSTDQNFHPQPGDVIFYLNP